MSNENGVSSKAGDSNKDSDQVLKEGVTSEKGEGEGPNEEKGEDAQPQQPEHSFSVKIESPGLEPFELAVCIFIHLLTNLL